MVSQEQAVVSSLIISAFSAYMLWSLIQTGSFEPYTVYPTPDIGNIILFVFLLSVVLAGIILLGYFFFTAVNFLLTKKRKILPGTTIWIVYLSIIGISFITLLLHVFSLVNLSVSLLSYAIIWGIVMYGRFKEKKRREKYLTAGNRARETKNPLKI